MVTRSPQIFALHAPRLPLGSYKQKISLFNFAREIACAHIAQGSSVTKIVQFDSTLVPKTEAASLIARISMLLGLKVALLCYAETRMVSVISSL